MYQYMGVPCQEKKKELECEQQRNNEVKEESELIANS